ncbi:MAG: hypothetical protein GWN01_15120 [Nitrosopumilaceae archaeon]|nr:hypothetical protein [Nitrosopumilaceae archaeon]NIU88649.1 hypothetical protein [Nitrosopumilaceae archaeon]NIV66796.1 hypothetical protein [Nitrosopumilaceae archaeon]NIX62778.1 hypothetical protein [Nitrosopumilaceae archaeon]
MHEQAGFKYDSSLAFEFYPGFRRGVSHPFHPFYPPERKELNLLELPPAWMDDHFDRRLAKNNIENPNEFAQNLLKTTKSVSGIVITDYHVRGMNFDFFPRYGKWLIDFARKNFDSSTRFMTTEDLVNDYLQYENILNLESIDHTDVNQIEVTETLLSRDSQLEVRAVNESELGVVAKMHYELFGTGEMHGYSIAKLGMEFLHQIFYCLNLDNPYFCCDVAIYKSKIVGFSVYTINHTHIFREMIRRHFVKIGITSATLMLKRPSTIISVIKNFRYVFGETLPQLDEVDGWWIVAGVHPEYRSAEFKKKTGIHIAQKMFDKMEEFMRTNGCKTWYGVVHPENHAINLFLKRRNAIEIGMAQSQGMTMRYYVKKF